MAEKEVKKSPLTDEEKALIESLMKGCFDVARKMGLENCLAKELLEHVKHLKQITTIVRPIEAFLLSDDVKKLNDVCRDISRCWKDTFNLCVVVLNQCVRKIIQDAELKEMMKDQLIRQAKEELLHLEKLKSDLIEEINRDPFGSHITFYKEILFDPHFRKALHHFLKWKEVIEPLFTVEISEETGIETVPSHTVETDNSVEFVTLLEQPFDDSDSGLMIEDQQNENVSNSLTETHDTSHTEKNMCQDLLKHLQRMSGNPEFECLLKELFYDSHRTGMTTKDIIKIFDDLRFENFLEDSVADADSRKIFRNQENKNVPSSSTEMSVDSDRSKEMFQVLSEYLTKMQHDSEYNNLSEELSANSYSREIPVNLSASSTDVSVDFDIEGSDMSVTDQSECLRNTYAIPSYDELLEDCFTFLNSSDLSTELLSDYLSKMSADSDFSDFLTKMSAESSDFMDILSFLKNLFDSSSFKQTLNFLIEFPEISNSNDIIKFLMDMFVAPHLQGVLIFLNSILLKPFFKKLLNSLVELCDDLDFNKVFSSFTEMSEYTKFRNLLNVLKSLFDSDFRRVLSCLTTESVYTSCYNHQFIVIRNLSADSELNNTLCFLRESFGTSDFKDVLNSLKNKSDDSDFNNLLNGLRRMCDPDSGFYLVLEHAFVLHDLKDLSEINSDLKELLDSLKKFCYDPNFSLTLYFLKIVLEDGELISLFSISDDVLEARYSQRTKNGLSLNKLNAIFFKVILHCAECFTESSVTVIRETLSDQTLITKVGKVADLSRKLCDMVQDLGKSSCIARELQELTKVKNLMKYFICPASHCLGRHSTDHSFSMENLASTDCMTGEEIDNIVETICSINTKLLQDMLYEHVYYLVSDAQDIKDVLCNLAAIVEDTNSTAVQLIWKILDNMEIIKEFYSLNSMMQNISSTLKEIKSLIGSSEKTSTLDLCCMRHDLSPSCLLNFFAGKLLCFIILSNDALCDFQLSEDDKLHVSNELTIHSRAFAQFTVFEQKELLELTRNFSTQSITLKEFHNRPLVKEYMIKLDTEIHAAAEYVKDKYEVDNVNNIRIGESLCFGELKPHQVCRLANVLKNSLFDAKPCLMNVAAKLAISQGAKNLTDYIAAGEFAVTRVNEETAKRMKIQGNIAKKIVKKQIAEDFLNNEKKFSILTQEFSKLHQQLNVHNVTSYPNFLNTMSAACHYYKHRKFPKVNPDTDVNPKEYMELAIMTATMSEIFDMKWTQDGELIICTFISNEFGTKCILFEILENGKIGISTLMPADKKMINDS